MVRTWAPRGHTPILRHHYRRAKISVISGVAVSPVRKRLNLFFQLYFDNIGQEEVVIFLRDLLRHVRGEVVVLFDNARIHHGRLVKKLLCRHPRLHLEYFPPYAPELNPDEGVWSQAKRSLANGSPGSAGQLMRDVVRAIAGIRRSPTKLRACVRQSTLPPFLP